MGPNAKNLNRNNNTKQIQNIFNAQTRMFSIFQDFYIDSEDYYNPLKTKIINYYETMDYKITKKNYFYFKTGVLHNMKDWFSNTRNTTSITGYDRLRQDNSINENDILKSTYYEMNFYFERLTETYTRSYMKVPDLIAEIGGILKAITVIFGILTNIYNKHHLNLKLANFILNSFSNTFENKPLESHFNIENP